MATGQKAHCVPRVKEIHKREVSFSLVPSNLGRSGMTCSYSVRLKHYQVLGSEWLIWIFALAERSPGPMMFAHSCRATEPDVPIVPDMRLPSSRNSP